jgi:GTP 3',8-cyclase
MDKSSFLLDQFERPLKNLRLSVTDRCNLRCSYCMPEEDFAWLPRPKILSLEELAEVAAIFVSLGVQRVRLTGGEPLLRHDLAVLVERIAALPGIQDLSMTTNALLLSRHAQQLRDAGLNRITVSLDTLDRQRFHTLTRRDRLSEVFAGLDAARAAGFTGSKINTVVQRGFNQDEVGRLLQFGRERALEVRFIEYMDVGGATQWSMDQVMDREAILAAVVQAHGQVRELPRHDAAPADRFQLEDGTTFGIIASTTRPFCATCDRSRVTADGTWFHCLYAPGGFDLRTPLRDQGRAAVEQMIQQQWPQRKDRGAEQRFEMAQRGPLQNPGRPADQDPHLEMRTRGG